VFPGMTEMLEYMYSQKISILKGTILTKAKSNTVTYRICPDFIHKSLDSHRLAWCSECLSCPGPPAGYMGHPQLPPPWVLQGSHQAPWRCISGPHTRMERQ